MTPYQCCTCEQEFDEPIGELKSCPHCGSGNWVEGNIDDFVFRVNTPQVQEIRDYIKDLLEYLDGRGIILEDEDLVDEALDSLGSFPRLREIFELYQNDISE